MEVPFGLFDLFSFIWAPEQVLETKMDILLKGYFYEYRDHNIRLFKVSITREFPTSNLSQTLNSPNRVCGVKSSFPAAHHGKPQSIGLW